MSCYIVSPKHIDGLLTFAIANRVTFTYGAGVTATVTPENATKIGRAMLKANAAAYAVRYPTEELDTSSDLYRFSRWSGPALKPLEIRGGCACLSYQCSDKASWYREDAKRVVDAIGAAAHALCPRGAKSTAWHLESLSERVAA